jgi:hypothetical protein
MHFIKIIHRIIKLEQQILSLSLSYMKTFSTTTPSFFIRIVENKLTAKIIFNKIHFSANKCHQSFTIYDDLKIRFRYNFIKFAHGFDIIHCVG